MIWIKDLMPVWIDEYDGVPFAEGRGGVRYPVGSTFFQLDPPEERNKFGMDTCQKVLLKIQLGYARLL